MKSLYDQDRLTKTFIEEKKKDWIDKTNQRSYIGLVNWYLWRYWRDHQKYILNLKKEKDTIAKT